MSNLEFKNGGIVIDGKTYAGGKLYIGNTEKEIDVGRVIVDVSNNNFHLLPQNVGDVHDITDKIASVINNILYIYINDKNYKLYDSQKVFYREASECDTDIISVYANTRGNAGAIHFKGLRDDEKGLRMFRFITAIYKGKKYELNFMRFFLTDDGDRNEVNCILGAIQFDKVDKLSASINSETICYPNTADKMNLSKLPKGTNVCYNPNIELTDIEKCTDIIIKDEKDKDKENNNLEKLAGDIVREFETFIKSCDEK